MRHADILMMNSSEVHNIYNPSPPSRPLQA
uniref:Uncharacterized protein n=1 Tax=Arundo donax TaxID=35708 RepID=A0A0A9GK99_ARUDO